MNKELIDAIKELNTVVNIALNQYEVEMDTIISNKMSDEKKIEQLLDKLLDYAEYEKGINLFRKLCSYYYKINPLITAEYVLLYRELYDEEYLKEIMFRDKKILLVAFKNNISSIFIQKISETSKIDKVYLDNDFEKCKEQLLSRLDKNEYDYILAFGRKPSCKQLYIEYKAVGNNNSLMEYETNFDNLYLFLDILTDNNIKYKESNNAGQYLCNFIYFKGLEYIYVNKRKEEMLFIHVPDENNFIQFEDFLKILNEKFSDIKSC